MRLRPPPAAWISVIELEAQLRGLLVRQPVRHLRKDGAPVERAARVPRKALRRARLREHAQEFGAHFVRIGAIDGRRPLRRPEAPAGSRRTGPFGGSWAGGSSSFRGDSVGKLCQTARPMATARRPLSPTPVPPRGDRDERPRHDPVEQIGLPRLERDEPAEHVEEVQAGPRYIRRASRPAGSFPAARAAACRRSCGLVRSRLR